MKRFWKESFNDKSYLVLLLLVICMFAFGLVMSGIFKFGVKSNYNDVMMLIYGVFTQFSFLFLSFFVCSSINKNYKERTSLFYKSIGVNSFTYFWKKVFVIIIQLAVTYTLLYVGVCFYLHNFTNVLNMLLISYCVIFNVVCISSIFAFIIPNLIISIGSSILFWISTSILSQTLLNKFSFIAIFDQQINIYKQLYRNKGYLNSNSIIELIIYMFSLIAISVVISLIYRKNWINNGM